MKLNVASTSPEDFQIRFCSKTNKPEIDNYFNLFSDQIICSPRSFFLDSTCLVKTFRELTVLHGVTVRECYMGVTWCNGVTWLVVQGCPRRTATTRR